MEEVYEKTPGGGALSGTKQLRDKEPVLIDIHGVPGGQMRSTFLDEGHGADFQGYASFAFLRKYLPR